jgi:hypothetical protein
MGSSDEFDDSSVICADSDMPGVLYAYIDEKLAARIGSALAETDAAHGHQHFPGTDGKVLLWAVSIRTPLKDALVNGFKVINTPAAYDQWIAALNEAIAYLRSEKAEYEKELATAMCSYCRHALSAHLHGQSADLGCVKRGCACLQFHPDVTRVGSPQRMLKLVKGGKPRTDR